MILIYNQWERDYYDRLSQTFGVEQMLGRQTINLSNVCVCVCAMCRHMEGVYNICVHSGQYPPFSEDTVASYSSVWYPFQPGNWGYMTSSYGIENVSSSHLHVFSNP